MTHTTIGPVGVDAAVEFMFKDWDGSEGEPTICMHVLILNGDSHACRTTATFIVWGWGDPIVSCAAHLGDATLDMYEVNRNAKTDRDIYVEVQPYDADALVERSEHVAHDDENACAMCDEPAVHVLYDSAGGDEYNACNAHLNDVIAERRADGVEELTIEAF